MGGRPRRTAWALIISALLLFSPSVVAAHATYARSGERLPVQNSATWGTPCDAPGTRIHDIQGAAHLSPRQGQQVSGVRGIVTAVKSTGFWFQDPCVDADAGTSQALFVFTATAPSVRTGDEVSVSGKVSEFRPGGDTTGNLTTTELTSPVVTTLGTGQPLPDTVVIGAGGRAPPTTVIDDDATGNVEISGTFDPATDGIDFYESMEGMRVKVNDPVAVGPRNPFGEIPVLGDNGANASVRTTRGGIVLRRADSNPERVILDDTLAATPTGVNVGDRFSGSAVGVLDYSFGNFKLQLTDSLTPVPGGITAERTPRPGPNELAVATLNANNLDATDPPPKFTALARQIVTNLRSPGIIAVSEIQDNDGAANTSVVDAARTWNKLISAIRRAGGPWYCYRQIDPIDDADGGEPGGNIRVGFLFRTDIGLKFAGGKAGDATTPVDAVPTGDASKVKLSVNPGRIDPGNPAFIDSRKPLAGQFRFGGRPLFVIANHWNSKRGDDPLFGRYQPPRRPSETQRGKQAEAVAGFVAKILTIDPQARVVVAGDLNDFEYSPAVHALVTAGLTDLPATLPDAERYSYVFDGNSQVLDHILISRSLTALPHAYDSVHTNAEFTSQATDHDPQVVRLRLR